MDVMDDTNARWGKLVGLTLYVDDLAISVRGASALVCPRLAAAVDFVTDVFEKHLDLKVSVTKSVVVASKPSIARRTEAKTKTKAVTAATRAKLLGTGVAGGRKRNTHVIEARLD